MIKLSAQLCIPPKSSTPGFRQQSMTDYNRLSLGKSYNVMILSYHVLLDYNLIQFHHFESTACSRALYNDAFDVLLYS